MGVPEPGAARGHPARDDHSGGVRPAVQSDACACARGAAPVPRRAPPLIQVDGRRRRAAGVDRRDPGRERPPTGTLRGHAADRQPVRDHRGGRPGGRPHRNRERRLLRLHPGIVRGFRCPLQAGHARGAQAARMVRRGDGACCRGIHLCHVPSAAVRRRVVRRRNDRARPRPRGHRDRDPPVSVVRDRPACQPHALLRLRNGDAGGRVHRDEPGAAGRARGCHRWRHHAHHGRLDAGDRRPVPSTGGSTAPASTGSASSQRSRGRFATRWTSTGCVPRSWPLPTTRSHRCQRPCGSEAPDDWGGEGRAVDGAGWPRVAGCGPGARPGDGPVEPVRRLLLRPLRDPRRAARGPETPARHRLAAAADRIRVRRCRDRSAAGPRRAASRRGAARDLPVDLDRGLDPLRHVRRLRGADGSLPLGAGAGGPVARRVDRAAHRLAGTRGADGHRADDRLQPRLGGRDDRGREPACDPPRSWGVEADPHRRVHPADGRVRAGSSDSSSAGWLPR
jgi:hypothetical protein